MPECIIEKHRLYISLNEMQNFLFTKIANIILELFINLFTLLIKNFNIF